jgi:hypothetical protein
MAQAGRVVAHHGRRPARKRRLEKWPTSSSTLWRRRQNPDLKSSAILADEFHHKAAELAKYGRVLVLLDACHSGGVTANADLLRSIIAASNVTVLTSRIR